MVPFFEWGWIEVNGGCIVMCVCIYIYNCIYIYTDTQLLFIIYLNTVYIQLCIFIYVHVHLERLTAYHELSLSKIPGSVLPKFGSMPISHTIKWLVVDMFVL